MYEQTSPTHPSAQDSQRAAAELVQRILGAHATAVDLDISPTVATTEGTDTADTFEVTAADGQLSIRATTGVAAASALRHYLHQACTIQLTWDDSIPMLPEPLPDLEHTRVSSPWTWRYYLNFCAFSYTTLYWDWSRWEREIDWMALHGINLPLCLVGQELPWLRTLRAFGVSDERARSHIGGPAFLPWAWMGCVHDHGTPVTDTWLSERARLGHRILRRQRELGMTPVLPGFTGYVPEELAEARTAHVDWMGFDNRALDPTSARFHEFGLHLLSEQQREYGTDHYYALDPFIEGAPPSGQVSQVADVARAVSHTLAEHDERNVWVLQGWPFTYRSDFWTPDRVSAFLGAIPPERLLALDLWAEYSPTAGRTNQFEGASWLWCMLHSLGGRPGMHGNLPALAHEPAAIAKHPTGSALRGVGASTECLDRDPVLYELLAEVAWHGDVESLQKWLHSYVHARYRTDDPEPWQAWQMLAKELYATPDRPGPPVSIVMCRPRVDHDLEPHHPLNLTAPRTQASDPALLQQAWDLLLDSARSSGTTPGLRRDIVDVGDELLTRLATRSYTEAAAAFRAGDLAGFDRASATLLDLIADIDRLAATWPSYRLDSWLTQAHTWGHSPDEREALVRDARRLLTWWVGPRHRLQDYAGRHWSGLVSGYYLPRWRLWRDTLRVALDAQTHPDAERFDAEITRFEHNWIHETQHGPTEPTPDTVAVADTLRARHAAGSGPHDS